MHFNALEYLVPGLSVWGHSHVWCSVIANWCDLYSESVQRVATHQSIFYGFCVLDTTLTYVVAVSFEITGNEFVKYTCITSLKKSNFHVL